MAIAQNRGYVKPVMKGILLVLNALMAAIAESNFLPLYVTEK